MGAMHDEVDTLARDAEAAFRRGYHHALADILTLLDNGVPVESLRRHERAVRRWRERLRRAGRSGGFEPPPTLAGEGD
jgi:hypothetical protein